jgi:sodium/potassium-transporting ATPase subunit alpha
VTLSLLIIAKRMAKSRVLVKNLTVIETLSCVNVIASDKTGTLTQNKMFVASASTGVVEVNLDLTMSNRTLAFEQLVSACGLCNNAEFEDPTSNEPINQRKTKGDATDTALLKFSTQYERFPNLFSEYDIAGEIPFNSRNKWMAKVIKPLNRNTHEEIFGADSDMASNVVLLKGAPDYLLKKSTHIIHVDGSRLALRAETVNNLIKIQNDWCVQGQRVLLLCKKECKMSEILATQRTSASNELEAYIQKSNDFCIIGMVGIIDPPREGISDVITKCREAGIRVFMVTGDYALTAAAIALKIGIFTQPQYDTAETMRINHKQNNEPYEKSSLLLTGSDLDNMTSDDWRLVTPYQEIVLARTTPEQKLRTVKGD